MISTFPTMGTVASLDLPADVPATADLESVRHVFDEWEQRFSLYRQESELSRVRSGELALPAASDRLRDVFAEALDWRSATDGAFTPLRPDGVVDLDGIVKSLAMADAGRLLVERGVGDWSLNVGGDILVAGTIGFDGPGAWKFGIVDPSDRSSLLCAVELRLPRRALATSGIAERGEHVWRTSLPTSDDLAQVTVMADDIVTADVLATAILSGGTKFLDVATERWPIDVLAVTRGGALSATPGFRAALATAGR